MKELINEVEALVERVGTHPIWGYSHCLRVYALAEELAAAEGVEHDPEILLLAALLHDVGLYKAYNMREGVDHARRSVGVAERTLRYAEYPPQATRVVLEAIEHHPPGAPRGISIESALLKDAVALDYLGAIGLARVFAMVGLEDEVPDLPAAVDHAQRLHENLPPAMILQSSHDLASVRVAEFEASLKDLASSTGKLRLL
jgi:uncharacterized protein